jgi:hypothetical protein
MARRERDILERAVHTIAEQAAKADDLVKEAAAAGGGDHPVTIHAKMLRLELLKVKADLERELETFSLNCSACGLDVHWVGGLGASPGHWAHGSPPRMANHSCEWDVSVRGRMLCPHGQGANQGLRTEGRRASDALEGGSAR